MRINNLIFYGIAFLSCESGVIELSLICSTRKHYGRDTENNCLVLEQRTDQI